MYRGRSATGGGCSSWPAAVHSRMHGATTAVRIESAHRGGRDQRVFNPEVFHMAASTPPDVARAGASGSSTVRSQSLALALLVAVQFMLVLDSTIVAVAMPSMATDLGFAQEDLSW